MGPTPAVLWVLFAALLHATWNAFLHRSADRVWLVGMMAIPYIVVSAHCDGVRPARVEFDIRGIDRLDVHARETDRPVHFCLLAGHSGSRSAAHLRAREGRRPYGPPLKPSQGRGAVVFDGAEA